MMDRTEFLGKLQLCYIGDRNAFNEIVQEYDRLNYIINEYEKDIEILMNIIDKNDIEVLPRECDVWGKWYFKLKKIKGSSNE